MNGSSPASRPAPAPLDARWRHGSLSQNCDSTCVDVASRIDAASGRPLVAVRDSKDPDGPVLLFTPAEWRVFLAGVRAGEFELPGWASSDADGHSCSIRDRRMSCERSASAAT